jgi:hypothetical protein
MLSFLRFWWCRLFHRRFDATGARHEPQEIDWVCLVCGREYTERFDRSGKSIALSGRNS